MAGDQEQTTFHTNMAQQYANVGAQNHMMGGYLKSPTMMSGDVRGRCRQGQEVGGAARRVRAVQALSHPKRAS